MKYSHIRDYKVSRLGLGMAALGRPGYINLGHDEDYSKGKSKEQMEARAHEMISFAQELGINYFDTARGYGLGEHFLESAYLKIDDVVGSKWGYKYTADWKTDAQKHEVKDLSVDHFLTQLEESRSILKSKLKIYHIHSATIESGVLDDKILLNKLWMLRDAGVIVGLSVSGARQTDTIEKALSITGEKGRLFESIQATFNLLETSCAQVLKKAKNCGVGVIVKEGVANGRLTNRDKVLSKNASLKAICDKYQCSLDALALAFVLEQDWVDVVLSGASTMNQLQSNCKALEIKFNDEDERILEQFSESPEDYWNTRSQLKWN